MKFLNLVGVILILVMLNMTTPTGVGPFGVLVFFTTLYFLLYSLTRVVLKVVYGLMGRKGWGRKDNLYAVVGAFAPIMLLFVQSFGAMSGFSVVLVVIFEVLAIFLVNKRF